MSDAAHNPAATGLTSSQVRLVLDVSRMLAGMTDLDPLLVGIAESVTKLIDTERASIFLHDAKTDELVTRVALQSQEIRVPSHAGIVGQAFQSNALVEVSDPYSDPRFNREIDRRTGFVTRNILAAPMVGLEHKPVGVVQAINKRDGHFSVTDAAMLQVLADQAGVAIQRHRLQQEALRSVALQREMELARKVQQALIPARAPAVPGLEAYGWTRPASSTGGDCFDLWQLPDGRLGVVVGDASGHGIAPALIISQVRTLIRTLSEIEPDPTTLLERVNARMCQDLSAGEFITLFLAFISPQGRVHWLSAGHGPVLLLRADGSPPIELEPQAAPIGITMSLNADPSFPFQLNPLDSLLIVTDGIVESFDPNGELLGTPRLCSLLKGHAARPLEQIAGDIRRCVNGWQTHEEGTDDQTVVLVRRTAPSG